MTARTRTAPPGEVKDTKIKKDGKKANKQVIKSEPEREESGGIAIKDLYLLCMCADPNCKNLIWSSSPDGEVFWPKLPSDDGYDTDDDESDPEFSRYGVLRRHCGRGMFACSLSCL